MEPNAIKTATGNSEMSENTAEISVRGKWHRVPAIQHSDTTVVVNGKWVKVASILDEEWLEKELENPDLCIEKLKASRASGNCADIFTFSQKLPNFSRAYSFPMEWDNVAAISLADPKHWWESKVIQETRKNVRRSAKRGVVVRVVGLSDELIRGIMEINNESRFRQGGLFAHYGKDFETVRKDYSTHRDRSEFICAYSGDELIGFTRIVSMGKVAGILEFLSKGSHYDKRPANALIAKAVEHCAQKGFSYLTYGKYVYGNKTENTLTEFKRRNGFEKFLVPRYYVPLTAKGRLYFALKLHRGLLGILPEPAIHGLLAVRRMGFKMFRKPV